MSYQGLIAETVAFRGLNGDNGEGYYARPTTAGKLPGVVLIHHMPGWDEWICEAARKLGYRGKSAIHPNQIETVNRIFTPSAEELDYYRRVVEAFDAALARGSAATTVDGKLVDYAMAAMAKRVMAWADSVGAKK